LEVAGGRRSIFTEQTIEPVYNNSGGIPRRINQICDMSLVTGFAKKADTVDEGIVQEAVDSLGVG
jgi:type II secretory pathway predicted ATPase ExeA